MLMAWNGTPNLRWNPSKKLEMPRANWVRALVLPVPPRARSSNTSRGLSDVSRTPPAKLPFQMKGKAVPVLGNTPPGSDSPYRVPEVRLTHGAGDHNEAISLKSPSSALLRKPR